MNGFAKESVLSNLIWRFAERCGAQLVTFVVSIVLARLLEPEVYGTIALVTVITTVLNVFVDSGLGNALIQKKDADELDFSTVFFCNLFICLLLYAGMFFSAPLIATFYKDVSLIWIIRVLSLTLVISGVKNVQQAYVSRTMQFKRFFWATLGGTLGAAFVGIAMAYCGFGVWALVVQQLFNTTVDTIILWVTVKWRPHKQFSFDRLKGLLSYGWKLLASALIDTLYNNIRQLIIGKMYSSSDLAFYNRGRQFPEFIVSNVNSSIDSVLLPTLSSAQDDRERVKVMTRRSIASSTYIMAPLMIGLAVCADTIVRLVLTDKWVSCVPFMRIFCATFIFYPIHTANLNAIKAMGRSDLFLKLEIIKKMIGIILLISTMWFGTIAMAYSLLANSVISLFINSYPNKKLLGYGYLEQFKDIIFEVIIAVFMGMAVFVVGMINLSEIERLCIQIVVGGGLYFGISYMFKNETLMYLIKTVRSIIKK